MPGPVSYSDKGGGGPLKPHGEDYFNRIVNVHWREGDAGDAGGDRDLFPEWIAVEFFAGAE